MCVKSARTTMAAIGVVALQALGTCYAWDTHTLTSEGQIWSEIVPGREGRIVLGASNQVLFAGISHFSTGGDYGSLVYALIEYGHVIDHALPTNHPLVLDQYPYQGGLPVCLDLAADTNGNEAITYSFHEGGQIGVRCATKYGTNAWALGDVVPPVSLTPYSDSMWIDSAMVDGRAAVAHLTSVDRFLHWSVHTSDTSWATELVATNAQGPVMVAVSPQGIPTISFMSASNYCWAYRLGGSWTSEIVSSGIVSVAALAFDRNGAVSTAYRPAGASNLSYATRGTFGGWSGEEIATATSSKAGYVDLDFNHENAPCLAYADDYNAYFAQRVGPTQWSEYLVAASTCGSGGSPPCFYSWIYMGWEPDLLYVADGTPIILHNGRSGNYKVSSEGFVYYTSWARMRETPWDWVYHDDDDGLDDRTTIWIADAGTYALWQTEVVDSDDVSIRMLTSTEFGNIGGQMWVRWWDGSQEHWVRGFPEGEVILEPGDLNGLPVIGSVTVTQWKCDIAASVTQPGANYYAIQVKVGSTLPLGQVVFDEDWLLRDAAGTAQGTTNDVGQAMSEIAEFVGHDWSVTVHADTDGDGIPDYWEEARGLSPTNAADALLDSDGDNVLNRDEYVANTLPKDSGSFLAVDEFPAGNPCVVTFFGFANRLYTLESCCGGAEGGPGSGWEASSTYLRIRGSNDTQSATTTPSATSEFFRVRVNLP